jgi:Na+/H+ antiporter NhaC
LRLVWHYYETLASIVTHIKIQILYTMKKFILSATFLAFAGFSAVQASEVNTIKNAAIVAVQDSAVKTPVKLEELPEPVTTALKSDAYKGWSATEAWSVKEGAKEYFLINVKKEAETGSVKIDKDGKPVQ